MNKQTKVIIGIAAFVLLLLLATLGYNLFAPKYSQQDDSLSNSSQAEKNVAPDFTVQDASGTDVSLSDFKGEPVVLNFWASWCPPCKAEMPDYEKMYQEYSPKGVVFMMVNLTDGDRETTDRAKQFLNDNNYTFPAYFDTTLSAADAYEIYAIPKSIFIDQDGNVVNTYETMIDEAIIKENIEKLLEE
jgi:thiol-disulfide isomerase/thioredoxin